MGLIKILSFLFIALIIIFMFNKMIIETYVPGRYRGRWRGGYGRGYGRGYWGNRRWWGPGRRVIYDVDYYDYPSSYPWYNPYRWWYRAPCKRGCAHEGNGVWGCPYAGTGINDCVFASDCDGCVV
jgi:hypothetical protein